jgi:glycosyltransferase involved in cell wall biosynthesis
MSKPISDITHFIPDLHFISGGPPQSVTSLADAQSNTNTAIIYHASDKKLNCHSANLAVTCNVKANKAKQYAWPLILFLVAFKSRSSIIHVHSMFNLFTTIVLLSLTFTKNKFYLHPRGMLEMWGIEKSNTHLKMIFLKLIFRRSFLNRCVFVASSEQEKLGIILLLPSASVVVIPNGLSDLNKNSQLHIKTVKGKRNFLFLSRIHKKKGLEFLLDAWARTSLKNSKLYIVGTGEKKYVASIKQKAIELGIDHRIFFMGQLVGNEKSQIFEDCDFFLFPSYSENFGNVVPEALSYGLMVLASDSVPWKHMEDFDCGYSRPHDQAIWASMIDYFNSVDDDFIRNRSENCISFADQYRVENIVSKYQEMYNLDD